MEQSGKDSSLKILRRNNTNHVLEILAREGKSSRGVLAKRLGVSKMTITNIITELIQEDYVEEVELGVNGEAGNTGPKPMAIRIKPMRIMAIGLHIIKDQIIGVLVDHITGEVYRSYCWAEDIDTNQTLIQYIKTVMADILEKNEEYRSKILGIGIGYDGSIDKEKGTIYYKACDMDKNEIKIKAILERLYGYPVVIGTYIQSIALAEMVYGSGKGKNEFYYLSIMEETRGALIRESTLFLGKTGNTGEVGHTSIRFDGPICVCGNYGCYNLYVNTSNLLNQSHSLSVHELLYKLENKEPLAIRTMDRFVQLTTILMANIITMYDIEHIIIGGDIAILPSIYFKQIEGRLNLNKIFKKQKYIKVSQGSTTNEEREQGSALLVFHNIFTGDGQIQFYKKGL